MRFVFKIFRLSAILIALWTGYSPNAFTQNLSDVEGSFLFKINRSRDADEIWYTVNSNTKGIPDYDRPIEAFWVRKTKNNETEPLTWIQNKYAYGIRIIQPYNKKTENLKFQFVSYARQTFELRKTTDGNYKVYTQIENKEIEVAWIFVQIDGGSFWVPSIPYIKLTGYDITSSDLIAQTIKP